MVHHCDINIKQKGLSSGKLVQVGLGKLFIYPIICCHVCHAKLAKKLVNRHNVTATYHCYHSCKSTYVHQIVGNTEDRYVMKKITGQHSLYSTCIFRYQIVIMNTFPLQNSLTSLNIKHFCQRNKIK